MRKKIYGQSQNTSCIFCGAIATATNGQGLPACIKHTTQELEDIRCTCGEWLDIKQSKWGAFFTCVNCGAVSLQKGLSMKDVGGKLNKKFRKDVPSIFDLAEQWDLENKR